MELELWSYHDIESISSSSPTLSVADAISKAEAALGGKYNDHPSSLEYFVKPDQSVVLTHVVQIVNDAADEWVEAFVDAHTGELVSIVDFVSHASVSIFFFYPVLSLNIPQYRVLPINKQIIAEGLETVVDPADIQASPYGWHNTGTGTTQITLVSTFALTNLSYEQRFQKHWWKQRCYLQVVRQQWYRCSDLRHEQLQLRSRPRPGAHCHQQSEGCRRQCFLRCEQGPRPHIPLRLHREDLQLPAEQLRQGRLWKRPRSCFRPG